jgi:hypothetical protein
MESLSSTVKAFRLDIVQFDGRVTVHNLGDNTNSPGDNTSSVDLEIWERQPRPIGGGAYGVVWVEKCLSGRKRNAMRAVKQILTATGTKTSDYKRELEAICTFSSDEVRHARRTSQTPLAAKLTTISIVLLLFRQVFRMV